MSIFRNFHAIIMDKGVTFKRSFPHTVTVLFPTRVVVAQFKQGTAPQSVYLLLEDGRMVSPPEPIVASEVKLTNDTIQQAGVLSGKEIEMHQQIQSWLSAEYIKDVTDVQVKSSDEIVWKFVTFTAITEQNGLETQLRSLQSLLRASTMDMTDKVIDLRFAHPVVRSITE